MSSADRQRIHNPTGSCLDGFRNGSADCLEAFKYFFVEPGLQIGGYGKATQQHHGENMERFYSSFCRVNEAADHQKSIQADDCNAQQGEKVSVPSRG